MHRIFGRAKKQQAPEETPHVDLSESVAKAEGKITELENKCDACNGELAKLKKQLQNARMPSQKNHIKQRMKQVLKRRKMYEGQLNMTYNTTNNLQQSSFAIENAQMMYDTLETQKSALQQLKTHHQKLSLNEIEDMHEDMAEMLDEVEDVSDIMTRDYGIPNEVEDDELDAELDALDEEIANDTKTDRFEIPDEIPATTSARASAADEPPRQSSSAAANAMPSAPSGTSAETQPHPAAVAEFGS